MTARVVEARGREQIRAGVLAALSAEEGLVPTGRGTKFEAGNALSRHDLTLVVKSTDEVVYSPDDLVVTVPAGFGFAALQAMLAEHGQWLPLDGHRDATLGGIVSSGVAGRRRLVRGGPRDWLVGLEAILGDGRIVRSGGRVIKNVSGYDLCKLFVGSRGTLGVLTELSFKVLPRPAVARSGTVTLPDLERVEELRILAMRTQPAWLDLAVSSQVDVEVGFEGDLPAIESQVAKLESLLAEAGFALPVWRVERPGDLWIDAEATGAAAGSGEAGDGAVMTSERAVKATEGRADEVARMAVGAALMPDEAVVVRVGVLPTRLAGLLEQIIGLDSALQVSGHLGSGLAMVRGDPGEPRALWHAVRDLAVAAGGHAALERGPKAGEECFAPHRPEWEIGRRIKQVFDPAGILAPGRSPGRF